MGKKSREKERQRKKQKRENNSAKKNNNQMMRDKGIIGNKEKENYLLMLRELNDANPEGKYSKFSTKGNISKQLYQELRVLHQQKTNPQYRNHSFGYGYNPWNW